MRERKLKEQFNALAERLRDAQLTVDQLGELHSMKYFYTNISEEGCAKLRAVPVGLLLLLMFSVVCLTLSPLSQMAAVLHDVCGLQVLHIVVLLQNSYSLIS